MIFLSDAASVVLYHTFEAMSNMSTISIKDVIKSFNIYKTDILKIGFDVLLVI